MLLKCSSVVRSFRLSALVCALICAALFLPGSTWAQQTPTIIWDQPDAIAYPTPISSVQLSASAFAGPAVPVSLASSFNVLGITTDGFPFNTGGFDGSSWAWSSELLGLSVKWHGVTFPLGPADANDAVYGGTIPLPGGSFGSVLLLGDIVNNEQPPIASFIVHYTDGSSVTIQRSMSDWVNPQNYPGEALAKCVPTRHNLDGTIDPNSVCIYGYELAVDPARTLASITLPNDRNVVILAIAVQPPAVAGTFDYTPQSGGILIPGQYTLLSQFTPATPVFSSATASTQLSVTPAFPLIVPSILWPTPKAVPVGTALSGTQLDASAVALDGPITVPLAPSYRVNALYNDGSIYKETGFGGSEAAFSTNQLGSALQYQGFSFKLGPPGVPDAVTSSTIALPAGKFAVLYLLGAGANGAQLAQAITVNYTDGTSTVAKLNLSSWTNPQHFAGETIVASTGLANTSTGGQVSGSYNVYGYQVAIDSTRTVASVTLPANTNVMFLSAALDTGTSFPVSGGFSYNPPAGTVPATSITLNTQFQPYDTVNFSATSASTLLTVGILDFTLQPVNGTVLTATMGQSPSLAFMLAPTQTRYAAPITFSLDGTLPPLASVSFSPATVAANGGITAVALTITTRKLSGSVRTERELADSVIFCFVCFVPIALGRARRMMARCAMVMLSFFLTVGFLTGCGSGYADHVYPVTINATDGVTTHSLPIELHIQASPQ